MQKKFTLFVRWELYSAERLYLHCIRDMGKNLKLVSTTILLFPAVWGNITKCKLPGSPMLTNNLIIPRHSLYLYTYPPFVVHFRTLPVIPQNYITLKTNLTSLKNTLPHPFPLTKRQFSLATICSDVCSYTHPLNVMSLSGVSGSSFTLPFTTKSTECIFSIVLTFLSLKLITFGYSILYPELPYLSNCYRLEDYRMIWPQFKVTFDMAYHQTGKQRVHRILARLRIKLTECWSQCLPCPLGVCPRFSDLYNKQRLNKAPNPEQPRTSLSLLFNVNTGRVATSAFQCPPYCCMRKFMIHHSNIHSYLLWCQPTAELTRLPSPYLLPLLSFFLYIFYISLYHFSIFFSDYEIDLEIFHSSSAIR